MRLSLGRRLPMNTRLTPTLDECLRPIHRQVSQSMQLESTKKSPASLCARRFSSWAMIRV